MADEGCLVLLPMYIAPMLQPGPVWMIALLVVNRDDCFAGCKLKAPYGLLTLCHLTYAVMHAPRFCLVFSSLHKESVYRDFQNMRLYHVLEMNKAFCF